MHRPGEKFARLQKPAQHQRSGVERQRQKEQDSLGLTSQRKSRTRGSRTQPEAISSFSYHLHYAVQPLRGISAWHCHAKTPRILRVEAATLRANGLGKHDPSCGRTMTFRVEISPEALEIVDEIVQQDGLHACKEATTKRLSKRWHRLEWDIHVAIRSSSTPAQSYPWASCRLSPDDIPRLQILSNRNRCPPSALRRICE